MCALTWVPSIYIFMNPGRTRSVKHILSFRRSTLATASKKYFLKMDTTEKHMSYFGLHIKKLLTWYQSGTRPQNYFYNLYIARTSVGHSEDNILKVSTLNFRSSKWWRSTNNYVSSEKRTLPFWVRTTYSLKQAHLFGIILETIWLILIGNTCSNVSINTGIVFTHQSKVNRSNFFCYCVKVRTLSSRHPE